MEFATIYFASLILGAFIAYTQTQEPEKPKLSPAEKLGKALGEYLDSLPVSKK